MVEKLFLIRHGETVGGEEKRYKGSIDVPLSPEGEARIKKTADYFTKNFSAPDAIYTSNLIRAIRSAEIVAGKFGGKNLKPTVVSSFRERNFGLWEGMSFDEINAKYPDEFGRWASDPLKFSPMGGESTQEVNDRVVKALDGILEKHDKGSVAIAAHGGVNRVIICRLVGIPLENIFRVEQEYGALSVFEFNNGYPVLKLLNFRP